MLDHLRAGIAIHNAGHHHAAHDAWEDEWLEVKRSIEGSTASPDTVPDLPSTLDRPTSGADERLLHGLIQFTAAVHHFGDENWSGARGLAERAGGYLAPLPDDYRGVNVDAVRAYLADVAADPVGTAQDHVLTLTHDGVAVTLADLDFAEAAVAGPVLAEEFDGYDESVLADAVEFARDDLADGDATSEFRALVVDFVRDEANRGIVYDRLSSHVDRRRREREDLEGLF